ncbi:MAG: hypothetical protein R2851_07850 [Caldilineaceae bacterium]
MKRRGSGSASRSLFGGFVEWQQGHDDATSIAYQLFGGPLGAAATSSPWSARRKSV